LAADLHRTPSELEETLLVSEHAEFKALQEVDAFGHQRADFQTAIVAAAFAGGELGAFMASTILAKIREDLRAVMDVERVTDTQQHAAALGAWSAALRK